MSVAVWSRFRSTALSITFDDNSPGQFNTALPLLDKRGLKATFFVVPEWMKPDQWDRARFAASNGHEIGSHTLSHLVLARETADKQDEQMRLSRRIIDSLVPSQRCLTLAYPYGVHDSVTRAVARRYYLAAREAATWDNPSAPPDRFAISGRGPSRDMEVGVVDSWIASATGKGAWMVEVFHGIEDEGSDPISAAWFERHLDHLMAQGSRIWIAPFATVAEYAAERQAARITPGAATDSTLAFTVKDGLPDSLYGQPLSLSCPAPRGWRNARAKQGNLHKWCEFEPGPEGGLIRFEAVPDRGAVVISRRK
ncbi:MAG: polysaccharide deacetylase [Fibrobacteres bacterium]|nr:polysaccharide deacetylase [Fibrobacterota bacterium]